MDPHGLMKREHTCLCCGTERLMVTEMGVGMHGKRTTKFKCQNPACEAKGQISNMPPWRGYELSKKKLEAIFEMAGIRILDVRELKNQYWGDLPDGAYPWWFVKTEVGWIEIGWRKRVISIDWSDTSIRHVVTTEEVTKSTSCVHAWSEEKAIEYLKVLGEQLKLVNKPVPTSAF